MERRLKLSSRSDFSKSTLLSTSVGYYYRRKLWYSVGVPFIIMTRLELFRAYYIGLGKLFYCFVQATAL